MTQVPAQLVKVTAIITLAVPSQGATIREIVGKAKEAVEESLAHVTQDIEYVNFDFKNTTNL